MHVLKLMKWKDPLETFRNIKNLHNPIIEQEYIIPVFKIPSYFTRCSLGLQSYK